MGHDDAHAAKHAVGGGDEVTGFLASPSADPSDQTALGLNADRSPSATRDVLVVAAVQIVADKGDSGAIFMDVGTGPTPPQNGVGGRARAGLADDDAVNARAITIGLLLVAIVRKGKAYRFRTVTSLGTPTFLLISNFETTL